MEENGNKNARQRGRAGAALPSLGALTFAVAKGERRKEREREGERIREGASEMMMKR